MHLRTVASAKQNDVISEVVASQSAPAGPAEALAGRVPLSRSVSALVLALSVFALALAPLPVHAEVPAASPLSDQSSDPAFLPAAQGERLEDLLILADRRDPRTLAEQCDDSLAAAVARGSGSDHDLQPKPRFKKRSHDLFRTEREIEIGEREMLLRLRLRAKQRRAMSVELRF